MNPLTGSEEAWMDQPGRERCSPRASPAPAAAAHLVALLADDSYSSLRYYGEDGVADVQQDAD
jgi:hypothetical protein